LIETPCFEKRRKGAISTAYLLGKAENPSDADRMVSINALGSVGFSTSDGERPNKFDAGETGAFRLSILIAVSAVF
jgi:hypothetical protein